MDRHILAIDQSTAGTKAMLFGKEAHPVCRCDVPHRQLVDEQGWLEHDPMEIYHNLLEAVRGVFQKSGISPGTVLGIGLSNQRETAILWDKQTGEPLHNAIVWQCARGAQICERIAGDGHGKVIQKATGIPLSPYYSAAKIAWVLENVPEARRRAAAGRLCCSTMDAWLIHKLCGGTPKTDYSNASRTQLFNIETLAWAPEVCAAFGVEADMLPEVCDSNALFGATDLAGILPAPVPLHGVLGDSHGALLGQGCLRRGMVKATYGTGSSIMMNIGPEPVWSNKGIVTSLAWGLDGEVDYVLEGNVNYAGAVIKWLVEDMELLESAAIAGACAKKARSLKGLYLVPAFSGLGPPYWNSKARAMLCGMNRETGKNEIIRAAEECIAYQVADILFLMEDELGQKVELLRVDGGPTKDDFLMQFQADILQTKVNVSAIEELSGRGAALAAGCALGLYDKVAFGRTTGDRYAPVATSAEGRQRYAGWKKAVNTAFGYEP